MEAVKAKEELVKAKREVEAAVENIRPLRTL